MIQFTTHYPVGPSNKVERVRSVKNQLLKRATDALAEVNGVSVSPGQTDERYVPLRRQSSAFKHTARSVEGQRRQLCREL